jgi:hypothetical protein
VKEKEKRWMHTAAVGRATRRNKQAQQKAMLRTRRGIVKRQRREGREKREERKKDIPIRMRKNIARERLDFKR